MASEENQKPPERVRSAKILVMEADVRKRYWLKAELEHAGWEVHAFATAREAFVAWVGAREPFELLIIDSQTAGEAGIALWCRMAYLQRGMRVLLPVVPPEVGQDGPDDPEAGAELVEEVKRALRSTPRTSLP